MSAIFSSISAIALISLAPPEITAAELISDIDAMQGIEVEPDDPKLVRLLDHLRLAFDAYRTSLVESRKNGMPRSCPPTEMKLTIPDLVTSISNAPTSIQKSELSAAIGYIMDHRYPCGPANPKTTPST